MIHKIEPFISNNTIDRTPRIFKTSLLTTKMSQGHLKDMNIKDKTKSSKRHPNGEIPKPRLGLTPKKKFQNMAVGPSRCCREVVTDCGQTTNKNDIT